MGPLKLGNIYHMDEDASSNLIDSGNSGRVPNRHSHQGSTHEPDNLRIPSSIALWESTEIPRRQDGHLTHDENNIRLLEMFA